MQNPLIRIIVLTGLIILIGCQLPLWWLFSIVLVIHGIFSMQLRTALQIGFASPVATWMIVLFYHFFNGGHVLLDRVSFMMGVQNSILLILLSGVLAGVIGVLSTVCGYQFRRQNG